VPYNAARMSASARIPAHFPKVGRARRLLGDYHVTGLFWYRLHKWAVSTLPAWTLWPITIAFTTFFFCTIVNIRRAIASNLEKAIGPCGFLERQRRIYATMWTFGWCLSERYERLTTNRHFDLAIEAIEHWNAVASSNQGFVMVTAHLGMYEVSSMLPTPNGPRHVHLVREPEVDPRAQEFIRRSVRAVQGSHYTMHFQSDDPLQGMIFLDALRRGEIVAMQGDRPRTGSRTVDASLFGLPIALPSGPAALARTAEVPMLPVFAFREGRRRCRVVFCPPVTVPRTDDRSADLTWAMGRVAAEVERAVRGTPHQWFVFRELWPGTRPVSR
jgi:lauroyl/myristoyl acyltransferase